MIVPASTIERVTGKKRPSAQIRWLKRRGWKHEVNDLGEPVVALAEFHRRMVGGTVAPQEPDYGAINGTSATH